MLTGHYYLQKHLHRIGLAVSPVCPLCPQDDMSADHLDACPELADIRSQFSDKDHFYKLSILYWAARRKMAE
uniref:Serine threonine-protein phosphatase 6 regulatory ankyrin repeat subunit b-like protein n=1 Tax=Triatoma infestans TaxID=30076 RepID=A0A170YH45_TRIIF